MQKDDLQTRKDDLQKQYDRAVSSIKRRKFLFFVSIAAAVFVCIIVLFVSIVVYDGIVFFFLPNVAAGVAMYFAVLRLKSRIARNIELDKWTWNEIKQPINDHHVKLSRAINPDKEELSRAKELYEFARKLRLTNL